MANQDIPILDRKVEVKEATHPDIQSAGQQLAASNNFLSTIGAKVAQTANTQMAVQLGYEAGKTPHGDIGLPLTEFDKNFVDSYNTQANSVLSLQGQKLLDDAHIQMSKAPRLTPELIASTHQQLEVGLKNIASAAPTAVKGKLEAAFASQTLNQMTQYNEKMFSQQREDAKNNLTNAADLHVKQANELAMNGDYKGALLHVEAANKAADSGVANRYLTPEQGRILKETAEKSRLAGQGIHEAEIADSRNKLPQFLKEFVKETHGMTNEQHAYVSQAISQHFNMKNSLRNQDENLRSQQMINAIATDVSKISGSDFEEFAQSVSPLKAEQVRFKYIQAQKAQAKDTSQKDYLKANWGDARTQANAGPKLQNATFNELVDNAMLNDKNLSQDDAEVKIAGSAGTTIPVFTDSLKGKLWSGDPAQMDSGARQIHALQATHQGHALKGLNDSDNALFGLYEGMRNPADPTATARLVIENSQNLDPAVLKVTRAKWETLVDVNTRQAKQDVDDWVLSEFGMGKKSSIFAPNRKVFDAPFMATHYAADIKSKYQTFYEATRGNEQVAKKKTQEYVDENYGQTEINGNKQWTLHPIEKAMGFTTDDGIPFIQRDIIRQMTLPLTFLKNFYDINASDEYWTIEGEPKPGEPIRMTKHERAALGTKTKTFDLNLIGNNFDSWDLTVMTDRGPQNLFLEAPQLGLTTYKPNTAEILEEYKNSPVNYQVTEATTNRGFLEVKRKKR